MEKDVIVPSMTQPDFEQQSTAESTTVGVDSSSFLKHDVDSFDDAEVEFNILDPHQVSYRQRPALHFPGQQQPTPPSSPPTIDEPEFEELEQ